MDSRFCHIPSRPTDARRWPAILLFVVCLVGLVVVPWSMARARAVPPYRGYVNDYADMISPAAEQRLERLLAAFDRRESTQIAILTIDSLEGDPLEDFSIRTVEAWKIGQRGKDNGVLLLVAKKERRLRIEVGYGLEGVLTDLAAGRIVDHILSPAFRAGRYDEGFERAVAAIIGIVQGQYTADDIRPKRGDRSSAGASYALILLFLLIFLGRLSRFLGAATGMVGFPLLTYLTAGAALPMLLLSIPFGLAAGLLLPTIFRGGPGVFVVGPGIYHRHDDFPGGFGGFGGGGGGFGGFGGGGFGGGGASGGW